MTARKIRMTAVGLVAMPVDRDETTVTADDLASDPDLCTAWAEIMGMLIDADAEESVLWCEALDAAGDNNEERLRWALNRARGKSLVAGLDHLLASLEAGRLLPGKPTTEHEDAALAMLPPVAGRQAA